MKEREKLLRQLISKAEDACEKRKQKRVIRTFFVLSGVVYLAAFSWGSMNSIKDYLLWLIGAPILAGLIIFGSALVLLYIFNGAMEDAKYIASLNGELNATVRFNNRINKEKL
jgi:phosphatidylserine synthase